MAESSKPPASHRWRPRTDGAAPDRPAPRSWRTLLSVLAAMLLLAGVIVGLLFWLRTPPRPRFIAVWIDQYTDPLLPPNGWSGQDRQALLGLDWRDVHHFGRQQLTSVRGDLESLRQQAEASVVVFLSALAISGDDGDVCILPSDARVDSPETWLSLRQVLSDLIACEARHKLLILDIMRPVVIPRFGVFAADVASRTEKLVEKASAEDSKLLVLTACAAGQVALESEALGRSLFGYYLEQGLDGAADGYSTRGRRDGEVTVHELHAFVQARVDRWARQNRAARQTPKLFGAADDFTLLVNRDRPSPEEDEAGPDAIPSWLQERWQWLDDWRGTSLARLPATTYRPLQAELFRAERLVRAGKPTETIRPLLDRAAEPFAEQRKARAAALAQAPPRSLAEALVRGQKPPEAAADELRDTLHELARLEARAAVSKSEKETAEFNAARKGVLKRFDKQPFDLAWAVIHAAAEEAKPTAERLRSWNSLLAGLPPASRPRYAEIQFLQKVVDWSAGVKEGWPAPVVHLALQSAQASAEAQTMDAEISAWLDDLRRGAEDRREDANRLLFGEPARWPDAESRFTEALAQYDVLRHHATVLEGSRRRVQDAFVLLPACLPAIENDRAAWDDWKAAAQAARDLQIMFHDKPKGPERDAALTKMEVPYRTLKSRLHNSLALPLSADRWKAIMEPPARQRAEAVRDIDGLLLRPWLSVDERAKLWKTGHALAATLNAETLAQDAVEDQKHQPTSAPAAMSSEVLNQERDRAALRAAFAIELLALAGGADVRELERWWSAAENQPLDSKAWDDLRRETRKAWLRFRQEQRDESYD